MPAPNTIRADVLRLEPGAWVELYDLDLTPLGSIVLSFHGHTFGNIVFGGTTYVPAPIQATGFERSTGGQAARPKLTVGNINSAITTYLKTYGDIAGMKLTRTRTLAKYLDIATGVNVPAGIATNPDPTQYVPKDIFKIERKSAETNQKVDFELSMTSDVEGTLLPRRQVMSNSCGWIYRGPDCGYAASAAGTIFYDATRTPRTVIVDRGLWLAGNTYAIGDGSYILINSVRRYFISLVGSNIGNAPATSPASWAADIDQKCVSDCKLRWGANAALPFGGFPGTSRLPNS